MAGAENSSTLKQNKFLDGRFGKTACGEEGCKCEDFVYMFRRPEEIGQAFLTRRKGDLVCTKFL